MSQNRWWLKLSDPDEPVPLVSPGADTRVLLPSDERFDALAGKLIANGAQVRRTRYLLEDESIVGADSDLVAESRDCHLNRPRRRATTRERGPGALAARDAFDLIWTTHEPVDPDNARPVTATDLIPADWLPYLPHPTLNPAQAQAVPEVLGHNDNLLVVAPTGAGKTVIGMTAALRTIREQHRKSAWLVPQRSLTDELNRDLETWRRQGLRVERLSGEHTVDIERIRDADLWVATTEKFEAICRATSLRQALAEVGSLVVDEVHLLGDPARGPVLEAVLARVRDDGATARVVGLSATISNGEEIASWLRARLLRIAWRPTRLSWQLLRIPANADWNVTEAARTRLTAAVTAEVTRDGGGVLVFCGSKRNVRRTALVIAAGRGADVYGVHPDDVERVHEVCQLARIGLHYQGWEHRHAAEKGFRDRDLDVLVATSTVAAGVNLPARAVVIRDTQAGLNTLDVATVQQMFGRAGRLGAGENVGWAFLIVDADERREWQTKLVAGHNVRSRIEASLPDHVLGEAVQRRITSEPEAQTWWLKTLANHQGSRSMRPLRRAVRVLEDAHMLTVAPSRARDLATTDLGKLTARLMISSQVGHELRTAFDRTPVPNNPDEAEDIVITALSRLIPKLAQASVSEDVKPALTRLLAARGRPEDGSAPDVRTPTSGIERGDLARAALLTAANAPTALQAASRSIAGVPYTAMFPVLEEAPRYLHWLSSQGLLGTIHPWCAIVAADLGRRIRWRRCAPIRGAGRLLWMCEQMAPPTQVANVVPDLWLAATGRQHFSPDWSGVGRPANCHLDGPSYRSLLLERTTGYTLKATLDQVKATGPAGAVLATWTGLQHRVTPVQRGEANAGYPEGDGWRGAALFTWRGDYRGTGWLARYSGFAPVR